MQNRNATDKQCSKLALFANEICGRLVCYIVDLAYQLFCILQVTTNLQSSVPTYVITFATVSHTVDPRISEGNGTEPPLDTQNLRICKNMNNIIKT